MARSPSACPTCEAEGAAGVCAACGAQVDLAVLEVVRGAEPGLSYRLGPESRILGRSREADITLLDRAVSRLHARIEYVGDGFVVEDLESAHGVYVDEQRVTRAALKPGCFLQIGGVTLRFELLDPAATTTTEVRLPWLGAVGARKPDAEAATAALDHLQLGVVLVDAEDRVVVCNRSARDILAERDGLELAYGVLRVTDGAASRELRRLLTKEGASPLRGGALVVPRTPSRKPLILLVSPLGVDSRRQPASLAVKAVFISDPGRGIETGEERLRRLYDLTPSEAAVAGRLVQGLSLKEAAGELAISGNTARTHLKRIFDKTDTHRQGELVGLLLSGAGQVRGA